MIEKLQIELKESALSINGTTKPAYIAREMALKINEIIAAINSRGESSKDGVSMFMDMLNKKMGA